MITRNLLILLLLAGSAALAADGPSTGPVIKDYGPAYAVGWRDVPLPENHQFKMVFDLAAVPEEGKVNRNLVSVARYLNMHARNGVPVDRMSLAVVVHGKAVRNLLQEGAHQQHQAMENPNIDLIQALQAAGVRFYVCGQSMAFLGLDKSELIDGVDVALSAMTMLTLLQADGYALLSWGAG